MRCASMLSGSLVAATLPAADARWLTARAAATPHAMLSATRATRASQSLAGAVPPRRAEAARPGPLAAAGRAGEPASDVTATPVHSLVRPNIGAPGAARQPSEPASRSGHPPGGVRVLNIVVRDTPP